MNIMSDIMFCSKRTQDSCLFYKTLIYRFGLFSTLFPAQLRTPVDFYVVGVACKIGAECKSFRGEFRMADYFSCYWEDRFMNAVLLKDVVVPKKMSAYIECESIQAEKQRHQAVNRSVKSIVSI